MKISRLLLMLSLVVSSYALTGCTGCSEDQLELANNTKNSAIDDANKTANDIDGDNIVDGVDNDVDNDGTPNSEDNDIDGDGIPNDLDTDDDGDGVEDSVDETPDGFTGSTIYVAVNDTVNFEIDAPVDGTVAITQVETINTEDVRTELIDAGISVETFEIVGIIVKATNPSDAFIANNSDKKFVIEFFVDGALASSSPNEGDAFEVLTISDLKNEISLNKGLFISNPGFNNFLSIIRDKSKNSSEITMKMTPIDAFDVSSTDPLGVTFILQTSTPQNID